MKAAVTPIHRPDDIAFSIGTRLDGAQNKITHSMRSAANFHHALIGTSGVGKTFTIRNLAIQFAAQGVTQMILDTQGDYCLQQFEANHDLRGVRVNEIKFGYGHDTCGLNPFVIHHSDQGGFHHATIGVLETIRLFNPSMGARQKTLLRRLIIRTYESAGIFREQPSTWGRTPPTMKDLLGSITDGIKAERVGVSPDLYDEINALRKRAKTEANTLRNKGSVDSTASPDKIREQEAEVEGLLAELQEKVFETIRLEVMDPEKTSRDSGSLGRLEAVLDMIEGVVASGLFDGQPPAPKRGAINVLDLTSLNPVDQQPVFYLLLERVFHSAIRTCTTLNPGLPDIMFGFDEVKLFTALADSPLDPINRFFTEGRKYGLGSLCGLQHAKQLTEEMRSSIGTIILQPVAKEKISDIKRLWGIEPEQMERLRPKSDALYGFGNQAFLPIKLFR